MTTNLDFYDSAEASQLAQAYQDNDKQQRNHHDWLFLICLFLALKI